MKQPIKITVNGRLYELRVPVKMMLSELLREELALMGTKIGCGEGECGACTVLLNGKAVCSCMQLAIETDGCHITTIEGLAQNDRLDPLQEAFIAKGAAQCGYCTPGMIMSARALLNENPHPDEAEVRLAMSGNFCRCTGYAAIVEAVLAVANGGSDD